MAPRNTTGAFDGLRLLASFAVLLGHSYALLGKDADEPLMRLTHGGLGLGEAAVYAFFAISGYLVTQSWRRDPQPGRFMARRALRIVPALAVVVIASFAVVGPLATNLSLPDYFARSEAWTYLAKILIYPAQYGLPNVFENNPMPGIVNGSLWSLRVEFALYLIVAALGWSGIFGWRWVSGALALVCLALGVAAEQTSLLEGVPLAHQIVVFFLNAAPFFIGAWLARSPLDSKIIGAAAFLVLATTLFVSTPAFKPLLLLALPLTVIVVGKFGRCDLSRIGDFSYGVYLWAFPVQQSIIHFTPDIEPIQLPLIAGPIVLALSALSWRLVEKRALALKPRRRRDALPERRDDSSTDVFGASRQPAPISGHASGHSA